MNLTPLTLITGLPGSGKTLFTLANLKDYAAKEGRKVYYKGIPELALDWEILDDPKRWYELPKGSIIVLDEAQDYFPPRAAGSAVPLHVSSANTLRHHGFNLVLITQHPLLIDNAIRKLVTCHFHVVRFYGFQKSSIHEFPQVRDNCDKSLKNSVVTHFIYPKDVFNLYKSADSHTIKKRIPMRLVMILVLPLVLIGAVWLFFSVLGGLGDKAAVSADPKTVLSPDTGFAVGDGRAKITANYLDSLVPRIAALPHTAPRYDALTVPTSVPLPVACVTSATKCICYTDQHTKYDTDDSTCRNLVVHPFYVDFKRQANESFNSNSRPAAI